MMANKGGRTYWRNINVLVLSNTCADANVAAKTTNLEWLILTDLFIPHLTNEEFWVKKSIF